MLFIHMTSPDTAMSSWSSTFKVHESDSGLSSFSSSSNTKTHETDEDFMPGDDKVIKFYGNNRLCRPPPDAESNPNKAQRRAATYELEKRRTTKGMLRKALKIYDPERNFYELSSDDVSALQRIFGVEDIKLPYDSEYRAFMVRKVQVALKSLLRMLG